MNYEFEEMENRNLPSDFEHYEGMKEIPYHMKLTLNGVQLDSSTEHELINESEFGYNVIIVYTPESWYPCKQEDVFNVTEVHHKFNRRKIMGADVRIAFESDIHSSGFHRDCNDIWSVTIEDAKFKHKNFRE